MCFILPDYLFAFAKPIMLGTGAKPRFAVSRTWVTFNYGWASVKNMNDFIMFQEVVGNGSLPYAANLWCPPVVVTYIVKFIVIWFYSMH